MTSTVTPMIHVPDVRATVDWYRGIGFSMMHEYRDGGDGLSFAILSYGAGQVMVNSGGQRSSQRRREVDLYITVADVETTARGLPGHVEVVEALHDTFYGMREIIIRDLNGFWITFGQDLPQ